MSSHPPANGRLDRGCLALLVALVLFWALALTLALAAWKLVLA